MCRGQCTSSDMKAFRTACTDPARTWYMTAGSVGIRGEFPRTTDPPSCINLTLTQSCNSGAVNCKGGAKEPNGVGFGVRCNRGGSVHDRDVPWHSIFWTGRLAVLEASNASREPHFGRLVSVHTLHIAVSRLVVNDCYTLRPRTCSQKLLWRHGLWENDRDHRAHLLGIWEARALASFHLP